MFKTFNNFYEFKLFSIIIIGFMLSNLLAVPESIQILIVSGISLAIGIFVGKLDEEEKNKRENVNEFKENEY